MFMLLSIPPVVVNKIVAAAAFDGRLPVSTGWGPGTYVLLAILTALLPFVVALLRFWPTMRKLKDQADGSLRTDLMAEVAKLRHELRNERRDCDRRLDAYQNKMDAITRKFFQFQLSLVRYLPDEANSIARQSADHILEIIGQPLETFMAPEIEDTEEETTSDHA